MDETRQMLLTIVVSYWSKDQAMVKELWSHYERGKTMKEAWLFRGWSVRLT